MEKKRIAIVTKALYGGGAERVIAQLANYLTAQGMECLVITTEDGPVWYRLQDGIELIPIGRKSQNKLLDRVLRFGKIRRILTEKKVDLVLSMPEDTGIYVILAMVGSGIPVVVSERNNPWVMPDVKLTRMLRKIAYPVVDGLIFQTEMARSFFPKKIQKKGVILPNPVDISRIPEQFRGRRRKVIVGAGRLHPQKNFPLLMEAFAAFYANHPDYQMVIYGEGHQRAELEAKAASLGLEAAVSLPGRNDRLLEDMVDCAMFVLSSDYEGSPNVLIEAMCMGMPVIATDCPSGGPAQLVTDGVDGILIPVGDAKALVHAMETLAKETTAAEMADKAYLLREKLADERVFTLWREYLAGKMK